MARTRPAGPRPSATGSWRMSKAPELQALLAEAREIDQVLARAKAPEVPAGAAARLLARAGQQQAADHRHSLRPGPGETQAAFDLVLGGGRGAGSLLRPAAFSSAPRISPLRLGDNDVVEIDDPIVLTGIDDATDLLEGDS